MLHRWPLPPLQGRKSTLRGVPCRGTLRKVVRAPGHISNIASESVRRPMNRSQARYIHVLHLNEGHWGVTDVVQPLGCNGTLLKVPPY